MLTQNIENIAYRDLVNTLHIASEHVHILFKLPPATQRKIMHRARLKHSDMGYGSEQKLKFISENTSFQMILEKDAGENQIDDFKSGAFCFRLHEEKLRFVVGDFTIQSGAGLVFAGSFGASFLSNSRSAVKIAKTRLNPYYSISENLAFRGLAAELNLGRYHFLTFYSNAQRDASIDENGIVIARPQSGLHISDSDLAKKDALNETSTGVVAELQLSNNVTVSSTLSQTSYSRLIHPGDNERQFYDFSGKEKLICDLNLSYKNKKSGIKLTSEFALLNWGARAAILGVSKSMMHKNFALLLWHATADFAADYGALPNSQIGETSNELGIYLGTTLSNKLGLVDLSIQREKSPWRTYLWPQPIEKQIFTIRCESRVFRSLKLISRIKLSMSPNNLEMPANEMQLSSTTIDYPVTSNAYLKMIYHFSGRLNYQFRLDHSRITASGKSHYYGWAQSHEFKFQIKKRANLSVRTTLFTIDNYLSRIYHFDYRLPGLLQPVPLTGMGKRMVFSYQTWFYLFQLSGYVYSEIKYGAKQARGWGLQLEFMHE